MEPSPLTRFLRPYRPGQPPPSQKAADLLAFGQALWGYPEQLDLPILSEDGRADLTQPTPPQLRRLIGFYARFFRKNTKLAAKLGIPPEILEALERGELTLSRLLQLSEALRTAAADGKLVLADGMRTVSGEIEAAAGRVAKAEPDRLRAAEIRSLFADSERQRDLKETRDLKKTGKLEGKKAALKQRAQRAQRKVLQAEAGVALRRAARPRPADKE